ncbi:MAG: hypothetical protein ACT4OJ_12840 [Bacteroidota bacterium]
MKKIIVMMAGILLSASVAIAQTPETTTPPAPEVKTWDAQKNPTVDSIRAKYKDKLIQAPVVRTTEDIFPVIGQYESASNPEAAAISISLDAQNKGIIWIEGLPQGKLKGLLSKSPATYKIPVQKTDEGKEVAEGTLIYDKEMNTLSICIGKNYNAADPASAFAAPVAEEPATVSTKTTKIKKPAAPKQWVYTGSKVEKATAGN